MNGVCRPGPRDVKCHRGVKTTVVHAGVRADVSGAARRTLVERRRGETELLPVARRPRVNNKKGFCEICSIQYDDMTTVCSHVTAIIKQQFQQTYKMLTASSDETTGK